MDGNLAMSNALESRWEPGNIQYALNVAQCEIRAMYKKLGYSNSTALTVIDSALNESKNLGKYEEIKDLFIEMAMRTNLAFPTTEQEDTYFNEGTKKQMDFQKRLWDMLDKLRGYESKLPDTAKGEKNY
jgi:hypothetical protein